MAKIYQTDEDFQRDKLAEEASRLRLEAEKQSGFGHAISAMGFFGLMMSYMKHHPSDPKATHGKAAGAWLIGGFTGLAVGVIEWIRSWRTGNKARDVELQRHALGAGTVVMPSGNTIQPALPGVSAPDTNPLGGYVFSQPYTIPPTKDVIINANESVNWQKKVDDENKAISLTTQKQ
jgi:hypothetical protein